MLYRVSGILFLATLSVWTYHLIERLKFGGWPAVSLGSMLGNSRPDLAMGPGLPATATGWIMDFPLALLTPVLALLVLAGGLGRQAWMMRREEARLRALKK